MADDDDKAWHLDKRVPIALIFTLLVQTGSIVWWARGLDARVAVLEAEAVGRPARRDAIQTQLTDIKVSIASLKEKTDGTNTRLTDIKSSVEKLAEQMLQKPKADQ